MARCLTTFAIVILFSGCCSVPPHVPFECPDRFEFADYSQALWDSIPEDAQLKINDDDLAMKDYIKFCETRVGIHNEL